MARTTKKTKTRTKPLPAGTYNAKILPDGKIQILERLDINKDATSWSVGGKLVPKRESRDKKIERLERDIADLHQSIAEKSVKLDVVQRELAIHQDYKEIITHLTFR